MTEEELYNKINASWEANLEKFNNLLELANDIKNAIDVEYSTGVPISDNTYSGSDVPARLPNNMTWVDCYIIDPQGVKQLGPIRTWGQLLVVPGTSVSIPSYIGNSIISAVTLSNYVITLTDAFKNSGYKVRVLVYGN